MKKFLVALLSLGLVMAFSMSAFAISADFYGQYYVRQNYYNNPGLLDSTKDQNWANTDQRLRLFTRLRVVEGVTLTMRADFLESTWGREQSMMSDNGIGSPYTVSGTTASPKFPDAGVSSKNMRDYNVGNVSIEQLYLTFRTGIGQFKVGNQSGTPVGYGTWFLNAPGTAAGINWTNTFGNVTVLADVFKSSKGDMSTKAKGELVSPNFGGMDRDRDYYDLAATYKGKGLEAGLLMTYFRWANSRASNSTGFTDTALFLDPYFKAKVGAFDFEGEGYYTPMGKKEYETQTAAHIDQDYRAVGVYLSGRFNMGPAWVRANFTYASGTDTDATAAKGSTINSAHKYFGYGNDNSSTQWSDNLPTILIGVASDSYHTYLGSASGDLGQSYDNMKTINISAGYAPTKKLSFDAKVSYAKLDKIPGNAAGVAQSNSDELGKELDVRATYKIYDALSYNIGAAYLWTGDYFKGLGTTEVENAYYLTHWLDLRF